jgi:hypothetical protein
VDKGRVGSSIICFNGCGTPTPHHFIGEPGILRIVKRRNELLPKEKIEEPNSDEYRPENPDRVPIF